MRKAALPSPNKAARARRLALAFVLLLGNLLAAPGVAHAAVSLEIVNTDPHSPATLGRTQAFSLEVRYSSDEPVIFAAEPTFAGRPVPAITSGDPHREAGQGDVLLWFAYDGAQRVDGVRVTAATPSGRVLAATVLPVALTWTGVPTVVPARPPAWVERLNAAEEQRQKADYQRLMNGPQMLAMDGVVGMMMLAVPGYFVLQVLLPWFFRGGWRKATLAPLWPMGAVLLYTLYALLDGSNIFPVVLIFTAPIACLYLLTVMVMRLFSRAVAGA